MKISSRYIYSLALLMMLIVTLLALDKFGCRSRMVDQPMQVTASLAPVVRLSRPMDAFQYWESRGYHGRIVVEATGRWQTVAIENQQLDSVRYPLVLKNIAQERVNALTDDNFLFVASAIGVVRRVITILPDEGYRQRREISIKNKTFMEHGGSFTLYLNGFAREFTTLGALQAPREPVLLYIEESFSREDSLQALLTRLGSAGLEVDSVVYARLQPSTQFSGAFNEH